MKWSADFSPLHAANLNQVGERKEWIESAMKRRERRAPIFCDGQEARWESISCPMVRGLNALAVSRFTDNPNSTARRKLHAKRSPAGTGIVGWLRRLEGPRLRRETSRLRELRRQPASVSSG
jgi:hypothetical protein